MYTGIQVHHVPTNVFIVLRIYRLHEVYYTYNEFFERENFQKHLNFNMNN